ncbi:MAG: hypothetical protein ACLFRD_09965 [Nitriliruptoraceae bacterium]
MSTTLVRPRPVQRTRGSALPWILVVIGLVGILITYARLRWPGVVPVGSDNDEYQLVGQALAGFDAPIVAGVEGTKYPLGYPSLLAVLEWLPLPVAETALVINLLALAGATALVAWLAGRAWAHRPASPGGALTAGALLATSAAVWDDVFSVMPELLTILAVAALLTVVELPLTRRRVLVLTVLAVAAVLLKTLALLVIVGGCVLDWLAARWQSQRVLQPSLAMDTRRPHQLEPGGVLSSGASSTALLIPAAAGVLVAVAGMLAMLPFPEHTTGYLATLQLVDPDDASQGTLGPLGLLSRAVADVPDTLADLGRAILVIDAGTGLAATVAMVALVVGLAAAFRLRPGTPLGPFATGAVLAYLVGMTLWPYHAPRFGLPLVPVAAVGVGWVVRSLSWRRHWSLLAGVVVTAALVAWSAPLVAERGEQAREDLPQHHEALADLEAWAQQELGEDEQLVSFDYREVAHALDRQVEPIAYTSDPDALWGQVEDADHLVVMRLYGKRTAQVNELLDTYPDRFELELEGERLEVYRIDG